LTGTDRAMPPLGIATDPALVISPVPTTPPTRDCVRPTIPTIRRFASFRRRWRDGFTAAPKSDPLKFGIVKPATNFVECEGVALIRIGAPATLSRPTTPRSPKN
jgi:hypothetical protein